MPYRLSQTAWRIVPGFGVSRGVICARTIEPPMPESKAIRAFFCHSRLTVGKAEELPLELLKLGPQPGHILVQQIHAGGQCCVLTLDAI